eukprot:11036825-Alexandrium_andersonii.AAC.1
MTQKPQLAPACLCWSQRGGSFKSGSRNSAKPRVVRLQPRCSLRRLPKLAAGQSLPARGESGWLCGFRTASSTARLAAERWAAPGLQRAQL